MDDIVQSPFHDREQGLPRVGLGPAGKGEIAPELALKDPVKPLEPLLLAQPQTIFARLAAAVAVHARSNVAALDGTLGAIAAAALEVELDALPAAQFANWIDRASHGLNDEG